MLTKDDVRLLKDMRCKALRKEFECTFDAEHGWPLNGPLTDRLSRRAREQRELAQAIRNGLIELGLW